MGAQPRWSWGGDGKWEEYVYICKVESAEFPDGLYVEYKREEQRWLQGLGPK